VIFADELRCKSGAAIAANACNAVQRKAFTSMTTFHFQKAGSSLTAANVRLLYAKHNLEKSDKILSIAPWIFTGALPMQHIHKLSG